MLFGHDSGREPRHGAARITFAATGRDGAGTKGGACRRELPAYRSVKVKMRAIEAAFDVEPEGGGALTVTGSGPLPVGATMRQAGARRSVPEGRPAGCEARSMQKNARPGGRSRPGEGKV